MRFELSLWCLAFALTLSQLEARSFQTVAKVTSRQLEDYYSYDDDKAAAAGDDGANDDQQEERDDDFYAAQDDDGMEYSNDDADGDEGDDNAYSTQISGDEFYYDDGDNLFETAPREWSKTEWGIVAGLFLAWGFLTCFVCKLYKAVEESMSDDLPELSSSRKRRKRRKSSRTPSLRSEEYEPTTSSSNA